MPGVRKGYRTVHGFESEISECMLNIEIALPLGLIVNELLTNSYKYAFTGRNKGNIHVKLAPVSNAGDTGNHKWELIIEDDGIGLPESFSLMNPLQWDHRSYGLWLTRYMGGLRSPERTGLLSGFYFREQSPINYRIKGTEK